jgi:hypothetical protein
MLVVGVGQASGDDLLPEPISEAYPDGLPSDLVVVDADTVATLDGGVQIDLVASAATDGTCPNTYVCVWEDADFAGTRVAFFLCDIDGDGQCDWNNFAPWGFNDMVSSWWNNKNVDAKWAYDSDGGGIKRCMQPNTQLNWVGSTDNDQASSLKIFKNSSTC